jgi:hypothetical protein
MERPDDLALEDRISWAALELATATTPTRRRAAMERLKSLVAQRTPERIRQMEQEKGLIR